MHKRSKHTDGKEATEKLVRELARIAMLDKDQRDDEYERLCNQANEVYDKADYHLEKIGRIVHGGGSLSFVGDVASNSAAALLSLVNVFLTGFS